MDFSAEGLVAGNVGTIVQVYAPGAYGAEFVDNEGSTYGLVTLRDDHVMRLQFVPAAA